jgi:hypothetical protein
MLRTDSNLIKAIAATILVLLLLFTSDPGVAAACGGSLIPVPSTLNFMEQVIGGKYEKFEEFEAVGENVATGGTFYEGRKEFSTPVNECVVVLVLAGHRCKVKVIFEPLAKELYTGKFKVPYETEISHAKGEAVANFEGKGK